MQHSSLGARAEDERWRGSAGLLRDGGLLAVGVFAGFAPNRLRSSGSAGSGLQPQLN